MAKRSCSVDGCERQAKARQLCGMHYQRLANHGSTDDPRPHPRTCSVPDCGAKHVARGLCGAHYKRTREGIALALKPVRRRLSDVCLAEDCERAPRAQGLCGMHYQRLVKTGSTDKPCPSDDERFWSRVNKTSDCWYWTAGLTASRYGQFALIGGTKYVAHRYAYEQLVGPIPEEMQLDHICWNRHCVNPKHLRVVTSKENSENMQGASSRSTTGVRGVFWDSKKGRYSAGVTHNYKHHRIGFFETVKEAEAAVVAKRNELFTHNTADRAGECA